MPRRDTCTECGGEKDKRAKRCRSCFMTKYKPRFGTGQGWVLHSTGYMTSCIGGKWVYQHRYIMEKHIGRKLESWEHVHHIDGDKTNNELDNLELLESSDHHKQHMDSETATKLSKLGHKARWGYVSNL